MLLPNTNSFLLTRRQSIAPDFSFTAETETEGISHEQSPMRPPSYQRRIGTGDRKILLPNINSFLLTRRQSIAPDFSFTAETETRGISHEQYKQSDKKSPAPSEEVVVGDTDKRTFLKAAGVAGAGLVASQLFPKKASALIMGSSPTTGVIGVKDAANARINPATEETVSSLLKTSDLTFDAGSLQVKVTGAGSSSFSDSVDGAQSALVDDDRHVQVDVLSSALPATASTETTLQTISFGGKRFTLHLATDSGDSNIEYVGEANIGTATSTNAWRIKKVDSTTGTIIQYAGTGTFDQIWDSREGLTYS